MRNKTTLLGITLLSSALCAAGAFAADPAQSVGKHHKPLLHEFPADVVGEPASQISGKKRAADVVGERRIR